MLLKRNIKLGINKLFILLFFLTIFIFFYVDSYASEKNKNLYGKFVVIKILDKVSSKTSNIKIKIGDEFTFQNLLINVLKCQNSKFDDDPEVTAYMQVTDLKSTNNNKVYVFNDWTFASSPSIRPFDHPVYDIWLKKCYS